MHINKNIMNKKILALGVTIFLFAFSGFGGTQKKLGFDAGYTLTPCFQSNYGDGGNTVFLNGFNVGPRFEIGPDSSRWSLGIAALFEMRTNRYNVNWCMPYTTCYRELYYGVVPIDLMYSIPLKGRLHLSVFGGPRFDVGIYGTYDEHYYLSTRTSAYDDAKAFSDAMDRFDMSVGVGVGIEYRWMRAKIGYDYPITNSENDATAPSQFHQSELRIGIGCMFNLGKKKKR
jgi:outer membrane protein assembly factor BamA